jgi:hypothetical protein
MATVRVFACTSRADKLRRFANTPTMSLLLADHCVCFVVDPLISMVTHARE